MNDKLLLEQWREKAYNSSKSQKEIESFWSAFGLNEKKCYRELFKINTFPILGTVKYFAELFDVDILTMTGFLDGINNSLKIPNNLETIEPNTIISLDYNEELLYKNMLNSGYDMSVWDEKAKNQNNVNKIEVVNKILSSEDKKMLYYFIHIKDISEASKIVNKYCKCNSDEIKAILEIYEEEYSKDPEIISANAVAQELLNKPKCPTCNSQNIKKISTTSKVAGAVTFGIFSKTAKSQFQCKNCGYKW